MLSKRMLERATRTHHVAADCNHQPLEPALVAADGQGEQRPGRMFVRRRRRSSGTVNLAASNSTAPEAWA
jgi:hypothetical protein